MNHATSLSFLQRLIIEGGLYLRAACIHAFTVPIGLIGSLPPDTIYLLYSRNMCLPISKSCILYSCLLSEIGTSVVLSWKYSNVKKNKTRPRQYRRSCVSKHKLICYWRIWQTVLAARYDFPLCRYRYQAYLAKNKHLSYSKWHLFSVGFLGHNSKIRGFSGLSSCSMVSIKFHLERIRVIIRASCDIFIVIFIIFVVFRRFWLLWKMIFRIRMKVRVSGLFGSTATDIIYISPNSGRFRNTVQIWVLVPILSMNGSMKVIPSTR